MTAVRDQVVIGTLSETIREEALKHSWSMPSLRSDGMRLEGASKGASEIADDQKVNKMGKYAFENTKKSSTKM